MRESRSEINVENFSVCLLLFSILVLKMDLFFT